MQVETPYLPWIMVLVACPGLSVVRETLGRTMLKCQALIEASEAQSTQCPSLKARSPGHSV
ncbi:hypothetical protein PM082_024534 [Marasmius tenuissimus]|nr:hypothetical protein PM082_024534 [Marasmius tenuissimus]